MLKVYLNANGYYLPTPFEYKHSTPINNYMNIVLKIQLTFCLAVFTGTITNAQNLVRNPGFESYSTCPTNVFEIKYCQDWWRPPLTNSPDYFNNCQDTNTSVVVNTPANFAGYQEPKEGSAYMGIICFSSCLAAYQEYLQSALTTELKPNTVYELTLYVSLADSSKYYAPQIQFCFSKSARLKAKKQTGYTVLTCKSCLTENSADLLSNTVDWQEIKLQFTATGGEKYLTIGNFHNKTNKKLFKKRKQENILNAASTRDYAYYYLDAISLIEVHNP